MKHNNSNELINRETIKEISKKALEASEKFHAILETFIADYNSLNEQYSDVILYQQLVESLGITDVSMNSNDRIIRKACSEIIESMNNIRGFESYVRKSVELYLDNAFKCNQQLKRYEVDSIRLPINHLATIMNNRLEVNDFKKSLTDIKKSLRKDFPVRTYMFSNNYDIQFQSTNGTIFVARNNVNNSWLDQTKLDDIVNEAYNKKCVRILVNFNCKRRSETSYRNCGAKTSSNTRYMISLTPEHFTVWNTDDKEALALYEFNKI